MKFLRFVSCEQFSVLHIVTGAIAGNLIAGHFWIEAAIVFLVGVAAATLVEGLTGERQ